MSATEQPVAESRSSIKLVRNAKGDCQYELKIYAPTEQQDGIEEMEREAIALYRRLADQFPMAGAK